mmetsp:Transcript_6844/g.25868  ORF Transcript_6844/g.25868 Transcript_6844/m.25868 type:complete len:203 (+) Transcript_6844:506-1114(+)
MHFGLIQTLICDPIPYTRRYLLVQQYGFDRRRSLRKLFRECRGVRHGEQWVKSQQADGWLFSHYALYQAYLAEPPRVRVRKAHTGVELDDELGEPGRPGAGIHFEGFVLHRAFAFHAHRTSHAEVEQRRDVARGISAFVFVFAFAFTILHTQFPPHVLPMSFRVEQGFAYQRVPEFKSRCPGEDFLVEGPIFQERHGHNSRA